MRRALLAGSALGVIFILDQAEVLGATTAAALYGLAALVAASHWGREAVESLWRRRISIDVLMGVAAVGSAALGLWEEAAFLAFLYAGAEGLEEYTHDRTRGAIRALLDLTPKEARLLRDGQEVTVPAFELRPGDRFLVRPDESLATDGMIRLGATSLDQAVVTGESVPVDKNLVTRYMPEASTSPASSRLRQPLTSPTTVSPGSFIWSRKPRTRRPAPSN